MFRGIYIIIGVVISSPCLVESGRQQEPFQEENCSRFVYEYKLMERLVKLEIETEALKNKIAQLESASAETQLPVVALKVRMSGTKTVKNGDRHVYDVVVTNIGDAYDVKTGIFTAPAAGIYSFTFAVCLKPNNWMVNALFRNAEKIGQSIGGDNGYHTCTADYSTVRLQAFDKVWVQKIRGNTDTLNEDYGWNSFSANLLQAD